MTKVKTHMMFQGDAKKAVDLYSSAFKDFEVGDVESYGEGEQVVEGLFKLANVSFAGHELIIFDSPPVHDFSFSPSMSIFVDFDTQDELEAAFAKLSEDGEVMMPLDNYGFGRRFGWITDRYGVSWQLNLPE
jgi:predicted 3-demethylubiquinone-9 3-methyltransferase (glyoxalase superfamily)|tara:strand:- start:219 stop:614 length:396 start_codon:yes stop_codon:yes gene_type:complete